MPFFASLPRAVDPDAGFVMTANNTMTDASSPYISYTFSQPFRAERIRSLLAGSGSLSAASLAGLQADTVSWAALAWIRVLGGLGPFADSGAEAARSLLASWDGDLGVESGAALLYACFQRALAAGLYRPVLGDRTWEWMASGVPAPTTTLVRRWLANDTWELLGGPTPDASVGAERSDRVLAALPAALAAAWASATEYGGADPGRWRWGDVHQAARVHPLSAVGPLPGVPMGGDADTIQAAGYGWKAGSPFTVLSLSVYRQVVDLASPDTASWVIPGGASGDPESPHFADQLAEWAEHRRIPMIMRDSASESGANPAR